MDNATPYFAYGSNLWQPRLECRVGRVRPMGVARLGGYALHWHKRSQDGSGKCDIVPADGGEVFGVVYELDALKLRLLDRAEGVGKGYERGTVTVEIEGHTVEAATYMATSVDTGLIPYDWYHDLVIKGARWHGVPVAYVEALERQPARADLDAVRAGHARAQLELRPQST